MSAVDRSAGIGAGASRLVKTLIVPVLILAIVCAMALVEPRFLSRLNLLNIGRNFAVLSIVAIGQSLVMIVGGFDLSVGAVVALGAVVGALTMSASSSVIPEAPLVVALGCLAGISAGAAVGIANGLAVTKLRVPPFMTTLGIASIVVGATFYVTKGTPIYGLPDLFVDGIGRGQWLGLPLIIWIAAALALAVALVMECMPLGRHVYAAGGNARAAEVSGIRKDRVLIVAYTVSGVMASIVGLILTARIGSGQSTLGNTTAVESIAAAVVGGISLQGGIGRIGRVVLAALFLSIVANALNLARIDSKYQTLVLGVVVLLAVLLELKLNKDMLDD